MKGSLTYFVADVHLGCDVLDPADRERRFVDFLNSLPDNTSALYMLGDVWDFCMSTGMWFHVAMSKSLPH